MRYRAGLEKVSYNRVEEDFNLCDGCENKFEILVQGVALSPDLKFFAISYIPGTMKIFRASSNKFYKTIADVSKVKIF